MSGFDPVALRSSWTRVLGLAEWAEMIQEHMKHQAKLRKMGRDHQAKLREISSKNSVTSATEVEDGIV